MTSEWCLMPDNVNKPVSYLVPMSERSSLAVSSALEDSNIKRMKNVKASVQQSLLNTKNVSTSIIDKIAFGGMSLWFLLLAILICVVLFSQVGKNQ